MPDNARWPVTRLIGREPPTVLLANQLEEEYQMLNLRASLGVAIIIAIGANPAFGQPAAPLNPEPVAPPPAPVAAFDAVSKPTTGASSSQPRLWSEVDYLMWWMKPVCQKPPLLSVGNPADTNPGAIGEPGTRLVLGSSRYEFSGASGIRPSFGYWFGEERNVGLEGNVFVLQTVTNNGSYSTTGNGPAYSVFTTQTNGQGAVPFSIPGVIEGLATDRGSSQLWGAEANGVFRGWLKRNDCHELYGDLVLGYRYLNLKDEILLQNTQWLVSNPTVRALGANQFTTHNVFNGGQLGFRIGWTANRFRLELTQKLGAGMTEMTSTIQGGPIVAGSQLAPGSLPGPFLAMPSNVGVQRTLRSTIINELNLKGRYAITDHIDVSLGYNFLYWTRIFCPGDMMDPRVNITQLNGFGPYTKPYLPTTVFARTDYFAQGWELGLQVRY